MAVSPDLPRKIICTACGRSLNVLPGDGSDRCKDRQKCDERRVARGGPPVLPLPPEAYDSFPGAVTAGSAVTGPCSQEAEDAPPDGSPEMIAGEQKKLAVRALGIASKVLDKIENQLRNGVKVVMKDGTEVMQEVAPMALASIARELRPIIQEPIRAAEAKDMSQRPLIQLDFGNPEVTRMAVEALRTRRERRELAAKPVDEQHGAEGSVIDITPQLGE